MSLIDLLLAAESAQTRTAVRRTAYRHVHVGDSPLVVVAYNLSGEAAAPLGIMYGVGPKIEDASLVVAAEPRNRDSRFALINAFAADVVKHLEPFLELHEVEADDGSTQSVTLSAPQVVVPNRATRAFIGARLGRSLRYLGLGDTHEVPDATPWTGAHLSWLAEHSQLPGQSTFLAVTEALAFHFVTGQSALEDENLATLLAWIEGLPEDPLASLEDLEDSAYGPVPDPRWEAAIEPWVKQYSDGLRSEEPSKSEEAFVNIRDAVEGKLADAYLATHRALDILRTLSPARSVPDRWKTDVREWTDHARRCERGIPRFARRHDAIRAARTLQRWSSAADSFEMDQAFDDPMIMARYDAEGRCLSGTITAVDPNNREVKRGQTNRTRVPLIELNLSGTTQLLPGDTVRWTEDRRLRAEIRRLDETRSLLAVLGGVRTFDASHLARGGDVMFAALDPWEGRDPLSPDEVPWTHREATTSELAEDTDGDVPTANEDGSPDLTAFELGQIPIVGDVSPGDEPGVVL